MILKVLKAAKISKRKEKITRNWPNPNRVGVSALDLGREGGQGCGTWESHTLGQCAISEQLHDFDDVSSGRDGLDHGEGVSSRGIGAFREERQGKGCLASHCAQLDDICLCNWRIVG